MGGDRIIRLTPAHIHVVDVDCWPGRIPPSQEEPMPELNVANRTLFHGDNLPFLRGINSGCVNLIATDPPFNKNKDFHATPNSLAKDAKFQDRWRWDEDVHDDWLIAIQRDEPEVWQVITAAKQVYGDDMAAFLCWLGVRLLECHRILADDGSLYLHIDHTAHAWVKCLMDAVFGRDNFRREIVWDIAVLSGFKTAAKNWIRGHDTILYYSKGQNRTFNRVSQPHRQEYIDRFNKTDGDGRRYFDGRGKRRYLDDVIAKGKAIGDVWSDIMSFQQIPTASENSGYPTQKPLALYERIIKASSNPDDMVLDPFCGCATTPVAAERLGRQWIGMDIWEGAHQIVLDRLESEKLAVPERPRGRRKQGVLSFGDIRLETAPPPREPTEGNRQLWYCKRLRRVKSDGIRPPAPSMASCLWTSAHSVKVAGRTTPLTPVCWKLTTSIRARRAEPTPMRT